MIAIAARRLGVSVEEFGDSVLPGELDEFEALDLVVPADHTERMLGLIAMMLGQYLGRNDITAELCCPWVDMEAANAPNNAAAKQLVKATIQGGT